MGTTSCEDGESNKMTYNDNLAECRQLCYASAKQIQCTIRDASSTTWQMDAVRRLVNRSATVADPYPDVHVGGNTSHSIGDGKC